MWATELLCILNMFVLDVNDKDLSNDTDTQVWRFLMDLLGTIRDVNEVSKTRGRGMDKARYYDAEGTQPPPLQLTMWFC